MAKHKRDLSHLKKQLSLPLEVMDAFSEPEFSEVIKQNWEITFSRQHLTSVFAKRVMGLIAAQIKEDREVKDYYQIPVYKIIQDTGKSREEIYRQMKGVVYELAHVTYFFENSETGTIIPRHLLDTTRSENPAGYSNGKLTVAFNPLLKGIVNHLAHYSQYELSSYLKFSSWYSMRLYELLSAFKDTGWMELTIDNYRNLMGCGPELDRQGNPRINKKTGKFKYIKYPSHSDVIRYTTLEPLEELKGTPLEFTVKPVTPETNTQRGRKPIIGVRFDLVKKQLTHEEKIKDWCEKSAKFAELYRLLSEVWKVSDYNIAKYSKAIGEKRCRDLIKEWHPRATDPIHAKPIKDREKFCNKAFYEEGEKALKMQEEKKIKQAEKEKKDAAKREKFKLEEQQALEAAKKFRETN